MKLYRPNVFNVIFLAPVAMAMSDEGGCSSSAEKTALTKVQIEEALSGNTVKTADAERYAYIGEDGSLKGLNLESGGVAGRWRISDNDMLCAYWDGVNDSKENCDALRITDTETYGWGGNTLKVIEGNPKNL